jgi:hypothetical protein
MIELLDTEKRSARNRIVKATSPGNRTLNRRTQPNARAIVCRLGYNTAAATYSQGNEIARFSGSSLNRHHSKMVRDEKTQILQQLEEVQKKARRFDPEFIKSLSEIELLRDAIARKQKLKRKFSAKSVKRGNSLHFLSQRSKGKIRDKCTAFHRCLGSRKTFVTLTFINDVTDARAISILNKFLTALRSEFGNLQYVRVSERQSNGRIHFHLIVNKFLPVVAFNRLWALQQYNAGIELPGMSKIEFMNRYNESVRRETEGIRHKKSDPDPVMEVVNSFDIKKIKHIYGLSYYLTKYITKNENKGFGCSAWHCSRGVSKLFIKTIISRSTFSNAASWVNCNLNKKTGEVRKALPVIGKFHTLYYIENKPFFLPELSELETVNKWIVEGMLPDRIPEVDDQQILKFYCN